MGKVTKSIEIEAPPEKVFDFINDMEKSNKMSKGVSEGEYTSKGPIGVGTTLHMVGKVGGTQAEFDMIITEFLKNRKVSMRTIGSSRFKMKGSMILEPTAKGTKLINTMDYEMPYSILGKIIDKVKVQKDLEKQTGDSLRDTKKALEA